MTARSYCLLGLLVFIALSAIDLLQTWVLIQGSYGHVEVYESNPVADEWLMRYGWRGLMFFKAGMVLVAGVSIAILARYRPVVGAWLATFACLLLVGVALYSRHLLTHKIPKLEREQDVPAWPEGKRLAPPESRLLFPRFDPRRKLGYKGLSGLSIYVGPCFR